MRNLRLTPTQKNALRIDYTRYSPYDDMVIKQATAMDMPLIGGTALELWAYAFGVPCVRKRSDNDLDFLAHSLAQAEAFQAWVRTHIDVNKVQTDVMLVESYNFQPYKMVVDGVLTMSPAYILWAKLGRGSKKDVQDIRWILSLKSLQDEAIQEVIDQLDLTESESDLLQKCMK